MRRLTRDLRYHFRLNYQIKAITFAKAPARIRKILLVLHVLYLQAVMGVVGDAIFGLTGAVTGAIVATFVGFLYFRELARDGQEAIGQLEAMLMDEGEVGSGQDPARVRAD